MSDLVGNHIVGFPTRLLKYRTRTEGELLQVNHNARKPVFGGFQPGPTQTRLCNHRRLIVQEKKKRLYYPCSEIKGADQLRSYYEADPRYAKIRFSHDEAHVANDTMYFAICINVKKTAFRYFSIFNAVEKRTCNLCKITLLTMVNYIRITFTILHFKPIEITNVFTFVNLLHA